MKSIQDMTIHGFNVHVDRPECACHKCIMWKKDALIIPILPDMSFGPISDKELNTPFPWIEIKKIVYKLVITAIEGREYVSYHPSDNDETSLEVWRIKRERT
jgi:hypothetical protein